MEKEEYCVIDPSSDSDPELDFLSKDQSPVPGEKITISFLQSGLLLQSWEADTNCWESALNSAAQIVIGDPNFKRNDTCYFKVMGKMSDHCYASGVVDSASSETTIWISNGQRTEHFQKYVNPQNAHIITLFETLEEK
jgi:hypothetical protein